MAEGDEVTADTFGPMRAAAFAELRRLVALHGPALTWETIHQGFSYQGRQHHLANRAKGIFWPQAMGTGVLSVKTVRPREGRSSRYEDIAGANDAFVYALEGNDPKLPANVRLRQCHEQGLPLVYLFGIKPGVYEPVFPVHVTGFHPRTMSCELVVAYPAIEPAFGSAATPPVMYAASSALEKRYAMATVKRRLHQDAFRVLVLDAYDRRCAVCRLPAVELLEAAHIRPDSDVLGEPTVTNGLSLCTLHHSVYDSDLMGITPDNVIEISARLMQVDDGPTLEHGVKGFQGKLVRLPSHKAHYPDRSHLEWRYERYRSRG